MLNRTEDKLQISCVRWFGLAYPKMKQLLMSFPAGFVFGGDKLKRMRTGARMKSMSYQNGTPDLFLAYPTRIHSGLWIEMKTEKGKIQPSQKEMMEKLLVAGYHCVVCRSFDEFKNEIENYLK